MIPYTMSNTSSSRTQHVVDSGPLPLVYTDNGQFSQPCPPTPRPPRLGYSSSSGHIAGLMYGDSTTMLKGLPDGVFNVAVTSPPYYWVRDYGYDGQLGHEPTVAGYIDALMTVFEELKRTLHPEGMFFGSSGFRVGGKASGSHGVKARRAFYATLRPFG